MYLHFAVDNRAGAIYRETMIQDTGCRMRDGPVKYARVRADAAAQREDLEFRDLRFQTESMPSAHSHHESEGGTLTPALSHSFVAGEGESVSVRLKTRLKLPCLGKSKGGSP